MAKKKVGKISTVGWVAIAAGVLIIWQVAGSAIALKYLQNNPPPPQ